MRITIRTTPNTELVPFDYQQKLVGTIHKWIGNNSIHDKISLYSFSWLSGGKKVDDALKFSLGATMFISFYDESIIKVIIRTILKNPEMFCGMFVTDITIDSEPQFSERDLYYCASPIFIKRKLTDGSIKQYNFNHEQANKYLKDTILSKMQKAGLEEDETLDIKFDLSYSKKKLKLVHYHGVGNKASLCPVVIKGKPKTKQFIWNVGVGNCTGIGFGAIY